MINRIKEARKALGLSREKFAEGLGLGSRGKIENIELGRVEPDDAFIRLISQVYKVNYDWLISGKGDMFGVPGSKEEEIEKFVNEALADESDSFKVQLLHALAQLTDDQWTVLADIADLMAQEQSGADPPE